MDCPSCHRLLYSRTHRACGYCGCELPAECLFSPEEIAAIQTEQAEIAARRAAMKAAQEEERRHPRAASRAEALYDSTQRRRRRFASSADDS